LGTLLREGKVLHRGGGCIKKRGKAEKVRVDMLNLGATVFFLTWGRRGKEGLLLGSRSLVLGRVD